MAGPLNGIGGQQQLPISNTFQPTRSGVDQSARESEDVAPQENTVQPQGTAAAETQSVETNTQDTEAGIGFQAEVQADSLSGREERGSLIDISV